MSIVFSVPGSGSAIVRFADATGASIQAGGALRSRILDAGFSGDNRGWFWLSSCFIVGDEVLFEAMRHHVDLAPMVSLVQRLRELSSSRQTRALAVGSGDGLAPSDDIDSRLYPYQRRGVAWLEAAGRRGVLGDDMGLGKTPQSLVLMSRAAASGCRRFLVVCPSSVVRNWEKEGAVWAPSIRFIRVPSAAKGRSYLDKLSELKSIKIKGPDKKYSVVTPSDVVAIVVTWGLLESVADNACRWSPDMFIADEAHNAKSSSSLRGSSFIRVAHASVGVVAATGTPLRNRHAEAWSFLHAVDPISWPSESGFRLEFCTPKTIKTQNGEHTVFSGSRNKDRLNLLTRPFILRREKSKVLLDLPPKTHQILEVDVDSSISSDYKDWLSSLDADPTPPSSLARIGPMRLAVGMAKIDAAMEVIASVVSCGDPIVVFVYHVEVRKALSERLLRSGLRFSSIVGDTPQAERQSIVESFQAGGLDVVIGSEACKEGITLTRSRDCLFVEYWWTPGDMSQASDRVHRISQTRGVTIRILHAVGTFDDFVRVSLRRKRSVLDSFNDRSFLRLIHV